MARNFLQRVAAFSIGTSSTVRTSATAPPLLPGTARWGMPVVTDPDAVVMTATSEINNRPDKSSRRASKRQLFETHAIQEPLPNERTTVVSPSAVPVQRNSGIVPQVAVPPQSAVDISYPIRAGGESTNAELDADTSLPRPDMQQPQPPADLTPQPATDRQASSQVPMTRVPSAVVRAPKNLRPAIPYRAQLREALQKPVSEPGQATSEPRFGNFQERVETRAPFAEREAVEPPRPQQPRTRATTAQDATAPKSMLKPAASHITSTPEPKRSAARRESRIHIGRVDVRLNNASVPLIQPTPAARPVAAMSGLETHFLSRFPIRV